MLGRSDLPFSNEVVSDFVAVSVSHEGRSVTGRIEHNVVDGTLFWRADQPNESGIESDVVISTGLQMGGDHRIDTPLSVSWDDEPRVVGDIDITVIVSKGYAQTTYGDCIDDELSLVLCDGCEREILGSTAHWRVEAGIGIDPQHNQFMPGPIALGDDEASALTALDSSTFQTLIIEDAAYSQG